MNRGNIHSWKDGYGVISHSAATLEQLEDLLRDQSTFHHSHNTESVGELFSAADKLANAAIWLVAHMTYASRVNFSGEDLPANAFKDTPQGHTGGSLNMAIAYIGYMTANALSGHTRHRSSQHSPVRCLTRTGRTLQPNGGRTNATDSGFLFICLGSRRATGRSTGKSRKSTYRGRPL